MKQDIKEQLLTKRPIDLLFQLSVPAVIGMIVIGLYPLIDGIFAGKIIGQTAMTACGVAMPLTFFIGRLYNYFSAYFETFSSPSAETLFLLIYKII